MSLWSALAQFLLKVPPFRVIWPDQQGIWLRGGKYLRTVTGGFYWKWPIYDEIPFIRVKEQVINLPNQSVSSKDGTIYAASGAIKYEVRDGRRALLEVVDYDTSLQNLAMGVIGEYICGSRSEECRPVDICREVQDALEVDAEKWGLEILDFWLTDFAEHKVYRIMSHDIPIGFIEPDDD